jgi:hypothetical protein
VNLSLIRRHRFLNPGGRIELAEIISPVECDDGTLPKDSALWKWSNFLMEASVKLNRTMESGKLYKGMLEELGFTDIVETRYKWPQNQWPKDKKYKELGKSNPHYHVKIEACIGLIGMILDIILIMPQECGLLKT